MLKKPKFEIAYSTVDHSSKMEEIGAWHLKALHNASTDQNNMKYSNCISKYYNEFYV